MRSRLFTFFLCVLLFAVCYPVVFLIVGSFMGQDELINDLSPVLYGDPESYAKWTLLPIYPTMRSYVEVLLDSPEFFITFWNSVKIALGVLAGHALIAVPCAWGFARYEFRGKRFLFTLYIIFMMLPFQVLMLSEYLVIHKLGLVDSLWAVILPGAFSTFPVFIMYNFFRGISNEVVEAARIDGASEWRIFLDIGIGLGIPGIAACMILQFLEYWNIVEQPILFLDDPWNWTLPLYLPQVNLENAGTSLAACVITLIPSVLLFFGGQAYLEKGIAATAVKK